MAYVLVENFSGGVDRSRPRYVGAPGSMWSGINGHLTRGGDFEKRMAFVKKYSLSTGQTVGLAKTTAGLYVFGWLPQASLAVAIPAGVNYMKLTHPTDSSQAITSILSWDLYNGKIYAIVQYANTDIRHFYDGVLVSDWGVGGTKPAGYGTLVKTHRRKVYSPVVSLLEFSALDSATIFDTVSGAGFQNMSTHQSGSDLVTGLGVFADQLSIFSRRVIQLWSMVDNAANNIPTQFLKETGTRSPRSVIGFGDIDCFYLSDSGIRSLRARSASNLAGVNDVGTPIDPLVRDWVKTLSEADIQNAVALVEPVDGRLWMAIGTRIFVFTYFPMKKISAWSWYEPGVQFSDLVTINDRVYGRAGNDIYLFGGDTNTTYDSSVVTVAIPFLSGGKPGTFKQVKGMDIAATGTWNCKLLINPNDENDTVDVGDMPGVTWSEEGIAVPAHCTHVAPTLTNTSDGYASISQIGIHTDGVAETKI